jgi:inosose dehydratase
MSFKVRYLMGASGDVDSAILPERIWNPWFECSPRDSACPLKSAEVGRKSGVERRKLCDEEHVSTPCAAAGLAHAHDERSSCSPVNDDGRRAHTTMRLGFTTWSMVTVRAEDAIPLLASIGYDSVELAVVPGWRDGVDLLTPARRRRIKQLLCEYEIELVAIAGNTDLLADDPGEFAENWQNLTDTVDLAAEWASRHGPPIVDTYIGGEVGQWAVKRDRAIERLGRLCDYAAERGVRVALQPHMDGALDTPDKVPGLLTALDRPNLGITLDINDFTVQGIAVEEAVSLLGRYLLLAQVKDERGRQPDYEFLVPGDGELDYVRFLRALAAAGYDGDVCVEISLRVQRRPGFDPVAAAIQSYRVLSEAFARAGFSRPSRHATIEL